MSKSPDCKKEDSLGSPNQDKTGASTAAKVSKFDDPKLDPVWLYETLRKEINHEKTYQLQNDAKLRAVTQGTANYEQFRQMVLGSHIRPLEKRNKIEGYQYNKNPNVVWNTTVAAAASKNMTDGG